MSYQKSTKIILMLFLGVIQNGIAQSPREYYNNQIDETEQYQIYSAAEKILWSNKNNEIYTRDVPDKWKGEASVILERLSEYKIYKNTKNYYVYNFLEHEVTKILSAAALEDYSTLYFPHIDNGFSFYHVGIKIIKSDGTEKEIKVNRYAIDVKQNGKNYKKIAIPDLEVGDIIDYYRLFEMRNISEYMSDDLEDNYMLLVGDDPILNYSLSFKIGSEIILNAKLANLGNIGFEKTTSTEKEISFTKYSLNLKNIEDYDTEVRWFDPYRELPNLRYQLFITDGGHISRKYQNIAGVKQLNENPNMGKVEEFLASDLKISFDKDFYNEFNSYISTIGKSLTTMPKNEIVTELFYFYRAYFVITNWEYDAANRSSTDKQFVIRTKGVLDKLNIPNTIVIAFNKQYSAIDKYILTNELNYMLRVDLTEPIFLNNPTSFLMPNEIYNDFQGTNAYLFDGFKINENTIELPSSKSNDNGHQVQIDLSFLDGFENLKVERNFTIKGVNKEAYQYEQINQYQYVQESNEAFKIKSREESTGKKQLENLKAELNEFYDQKQKEIKASKLDDIKHDYGFEIEELDEFKIIHFGVTLEQPNLVFTDAFTATEAAQKVGQNYIIPVGLFLGGQVEIEAAEGEREYGIYRDPSEFAYNINMQIPDGYEITELENLNFNVDNSTGKFIAKASVDGNVLKIITQKVYHHYYEPKENWTDMIAFLNAAYNFTQQKVLLRKI
jgi:hypothetical protein